MPPIVLVRGRVSVFEDVQAIGENLVLKNPLIRIPTRLLLARVRNFAIDVNLACQAEIPTGFAQPMPFIFIGLDNGQEAAKGEARRSGAQRGALENNFGQRFS